MELIPLLEFEKNPLSKLEIEANIHLSQGEIHLEFYLGANRNLDLPGVDLPKDEKIIRADELWKKTCFELFFGKVREESYYEVNLSPWRAWNAYYFQKYRTPNPPVETKHIRPSYLHWENNRLICDLKLSGPLAEYPGYLDLSAAAVVSQDQGKVLRYFAFRHCGEKPDFHLRESFCLKRGFE